MNTRLLYAKVFSLSRQFYSNYFSLHSSSRLLAQSLRGLRAFSSEIPTNQSPAAAETPMLTKLEVKESTLIPDSSTKSYPKDRSGVDVRIIRVLQRSMVFLCYVILLKIYMDLKTSDTVRSSN